MPAESKAKPHDSLQTVQPKVSVSSSYAVLPMAEFFV